MGNIIKTSPHKQINFLKKEIAKVSYSSQEGHVPSAYSIMDLLWVLFKESINVYPRNQKISDKFILSKGHGSLALYAMLLENKKITLKEFSSFSKYNSKLGGHPDSNKLPNVLASTGSLGHGLAISVGMAMSSKILNIDNKIYCLIGDGECNEGSIWESALLAVEHKLDNLCCILDMNHSGDRAIKLLNLKEKFLSFGWAVKTIDGHNHKEIKSSYKSYKKNKPFIIIAETIKGRGVKMMENSHAWHRRSPNKDELDLILEELN